LYSGNNKKKAKILSLFSGAGGLDLGFEQTEKFQVILANEILKQPVLTYSKNFKVNQLTSYPHIENLPGISYGPIEQQNYNEVSDMDVDVVTGGPPCQDFSIVRGPSTERQGLLVKRGKLYTHFARALYKFQPKLFVFENVLGLRSANKGEAWKTIKTDFDNLPERWPEIKTQAGLEDENGQQQKQGYNLVFKNAVNMSFIGVPQHRRRMIAVGLRKDIDNNTASIISKQLEESLLNTHLNFAQFPLTPIEVFEGKELPRLQNKYEKIMKKYEEVVDEVKTEKAIAWKKRVWDHLTFDIVSDYFFINKISADEEELFHIFEPHREILKELKYYDTRP